MSKSTPEGKVKKKIKSLLDSKTPYLYYRMPVPFGFGDSGLDVEGTYYGLYFVIEAKAKGKAPTPRQLETMRRVFAARGAVFIVKGLDDLDPGWRALLAWIEQVERWAARCS